MKKAKLNYLKITAVLPLFFFGCFGSNTEKIPDGTQPYVEAYIEYPGPDEKWAGPPSFVLHVITHSKRNAELSIKPAFFNPLGAGKRKLASVKGGGGLSNSAIREDLSRLVTAMQSDNEKNFQGCLYPVRVVLIRSDHVVVERMTCRRGQGGWAAVASEIVNHLIEASLTAPAVK